MFSGSHVSRCATCTCNNFAVCVCGGGGGGGEMFALSNNDQVYDFTNCGRWGTKISLYV